MDLDVDAGNFQKFINAFPTNTHQGCIKLLSIFGHTAAANRWIEPSCSV